VIEKRRYFRIQDTIGLALRVARAEKPELKLTDANTVADHELQKVEAELNSLVNALWGEDPKIAKSLGLLNRKIEILCERNSPIALRKNENFEIRYHNLSVSLSASGIGFISDNALPVSERFDLMMLLAPVNTRMVVKGCVVESAAVEQADAVRYQIRMEFTLTAAEEEKLVQFLVQRQVQLLGRDANA